MERQELSITVGLHVSVTAHLYLLVSIINFISVNAEECRAVAGPFPSPVLYTCTGSAVFPVPTNDFQVFHTLSVVDGTYSSIPDGTLSNLPELVKVDFSNNALTTLSINVFNNVPKLDIIILSGNPIVCDSIIDWLKPWKAVAEAERRIVGNCANIPGSTIQEYLDNVNAPQNEIIFPEPNYRICYAESPLHLDVQRSGDTSSELTISIEVIRGGAVEGTDFNVSTKQITMPVGSATGAPVFTITVLKPSEARRLFTLRSIPDNPTFSQKLVPIEIKKEIPGVCLPVPGTTSLPGTTTHKPRTKMPTAARTKMPTTTPKPIPPPFPVWCIILIIAVLIIGLCLIVWILWKKIMSSSSKEVQPKPEDCKLNDLKKDKVSNPERNPLVQPESV